MTRRASKRSNQNPEGRIGVCAEPIPDTKSPRVAVIPTRARLEQARLESIARAEHEAQTNLDDASPDDMSGFPASGQADHA